MITVAIVGLLASIAAVSVIRVRNKAAESVCIGNLHQISRTKSIWAFENKVTAGIAPEESNLHGPENYLKKFPVCPMGGRYNVKTLELEPD